MSSSVKLAAVVAIVVVLRSTPSGTVGPVIVIFAVYFDRIVHPANSKVEEHIFTVSAVKTEQKCVVWAPDVVTSVRRWVLLPGCEKAGAVTDRVVGHELRIENA